MGPATKRRITRWAIAFALILVGILVVNAYVNYKAAPLARDMLSQHFHAEVELDSIKFRLLPTVRISGTGLVLAQTSQSAKTPFISVQKFSAETSLWNMLTRTRRLAHVQVEGLVITVARNRPPVADPKPKRKVPDFNIDEIVAHQATLVILRKDPAKRSLVFRMDQLVLTSVSRSDAMHYRARLRNALPPGDVVAEGNVGPLNFRDTGATHLDGRYEFRNANLGVFRGISGILSSDGTFTGELTRIEVEGTTDVPDFATKSSERPVELSTKFSATVDGTNGDTQLHPVDARFLNSTFTVNGSIWDVPGPTGHVIDLTVVSKDSRVEDMITLAVKNRPAMTGGIHFKVHLRIDPGKEPMIRRIKAEGDANIVGGRFSSKAVSEKVAELSNRAEGHPKGDKDATVPAGFNARFRLADAKLNVSYLDFKVPGAEAKLRGAYAVEDETLNFTGTAMLDATISQMMTGWKSILLKAADPMFKSKTAGTVLPITITGTRKDPKFKVELGRLKDAKKEADKN